MRSPLEGVEQPEPPLDRVSRSLPNSFVTSCQLDELRWTKANLRILRA
jgi:hypothetical protein